MIEADPYPWPYDGDIVAAQLALVIAGAQPAWIERSVGVREVSATIARIAAVCRGVGALVVHVRHGVSGSPTPHAPRALPPVRETPEWQLATPIESKDLVIDAGGVDGFFSGPLDRELRARKVTHLMLAGFGAEAAVDSTLRSANDRGYECLTLTDAVAPFDVDTGSRALASVTMSGGIFGAIAPSARLLHAISTPSLQEAL